MKWKIREKTTAKTEDTIGGNKQTNKKKSWSRKSQNIPENNPAI